jgi:hypothetical protein
VNGLAIGGASRGIEDYYLTEVIRGPGAFVEYARNHTISPTRCGASWNANCAS